MGWNYPCSCTSLFISTNSAPQCKFSNLIAFKTITEIVSPYVMNGCMFKAWLWINALSDCYIFFLYWFDSFLVKRSNWLTLFVKLQPLGVLSHTLTYLQVLLLTQLVYLSIYLYLYIYIILECKNLNNRFYSLYIMGWKNCFFLR